MTASARSGSAWSKGSVPNEARHLLPGLHLALCLPGLREVARGAAGPELSRRLPARAVRRLAEAPRPARAGGNRIQEGLDVPAGAVARARARRPAAAARGASVQSLAAASARAGLRQ